MAEFELYCFAQSGNSYKPALMLELCGADWTPRKVEFMDGETRTDTYRDVNVMGEAPVLKHGDLTLSQSGVMLDYLADHFGQFGAENPDEKREIWRWILFDNHKLTGYTSVLRFMRAFMKTGETPVVEFLDGRARNAYRVLDKHLNGRTWIVGERLTIADLSLCGYLFFQDEIGIDFAEFEYINAWLDRIRALDGWKHPYDLMPGHPLPS
ncbi:MAG: glutathione S-transferase [Pseudomonadota bacterium]